MVSEVELQCVLYYFLSTENNTFWTLQPASSSLYLIQVIIGDSIGKVINLKEIDLNGLKT
jgi:hypothetical protein